MSAFSGKIKVQPFGLDAVALFKQGLGKCGTQSAEPFMRKGMIYFEAAREVYSEHTDFSDFASGEVLEELPYYGKILKGVTAPIRETPDSPEDEVKYGKIADPTVHMALNQLRK